MARLLTVTVALTLALSAATFAVDISQAAAPAPARWAIFIGDASANERAAVEAAQRGTAAALRAQYGYAPERIIELYGAGATKAAIRERFGDVARRLRPGDSLFIYILLPSIERKGAAYFQPYGSREEEVWNLLGQDEFEDLVRQAQPRTALAVVPSCAERVRDVRQEFGAAKSQQGLWRPTALSTVVFCERGNPETRGPRFAEAFAKILRNPGSDGAQRITPLDLVEMLRRALPDVQIDRPIATMSSEDAFAFVLERRRTDTLLDQVQSARTIDDQIRAIESLVAVARSSSDPDTRVTVVRGIGTAARNEAWSSVARLRALGALGEIGSGDAVPPLAAVAATTTAAPEVRRGALDALARIGTADTLAPLQTALADANPMVRVSAVRAVGAHKHLTNATPILAAVIDPDADVRVAALQMLAILAKPPVGGRNLITPIAARARRAAEVTLNDMFASVRREAVNTLARLGVDLARNNVALSLMMNDRDESVRAAVALTLGRDYRGFGSVPQGIGGVSRAPALAALIRAAGFSSPVSVRAAAMWSLGEIGDQQARNVLSSGIRDPEPRIREAAAEGLGKLRDGEAVPGIITLLTDDSPRIRAAAARALGAIRDPRASQHLIARIRSETDIYVRQAVDEALAQLPPPSMAFLAAALLEESPKVRLEAVERLGAMTDPAAAKYAIGALGDQDPTIRQAALKVVVEHMPAWFSPLADALEAPETAVRFNAAATLGQVGSADAGKVLLARFNREQTPLVRAQIAAALGAIKPPSAGIETALLEVALEPDPILRAAAAASLGGYTSPRVQDTLRGLAEDEDPIVREAAIRSLRTVFK